MPISLDPSETYDYVITTDRKKPKDKQPTLVVHYPTCEERKRVAKLFDEADDSTSVTDHIDKTCDALRVLLVEWRNFQDRKGKLCKYDPAKLDSVLSHNDLIELRMYLLKQLDNSELDKKKAVLQSQSNSDKSAKDVKPEDAKPEHA